MDPFRLLLNDISDELTEENLQSLIHIYNVPGGVREKMNSGLALFRYMITQDYISREKIGNLRELMREVRPRRKDLVRKVNIYIKREFQTDDVGTILDDLSESSEEDHQNESGNIVTVEERDVCNIDCSYFYCACRRVPSCYTPIMLLLLFAIIVTLLFWYSNVPRINSAINSNPDLKNAGPYILLLEILLLVVVVVLRLKLYVRLSNLARTARRRVVPLQFHASRGQRSLHAGRLPNWLILLSLGVAIALQYAVPYLAQIYYGFFRYIMDLAT